MHVWKRTPGVDLFSSRIFVPMSRLKLWNYIYRPPVPLCPSHRRRRRLPDSPYVPSSVPSSVLCPSAPVRSVFFVRPLSFRLVVKDSIDLIGNLRSAQRKPDSSFKVDKKYGGNEGTT